MSPGFRDPFADLQARTFPALALSAYLPAGAGVPFDAGYHHVLMREQAHRAEALLGEGELAALHRDLPEVLAYLDGLRPPPDVPLGVFCSSPERFLRAWRLPSEVDAELRVGARLHLAPIRRLLELYPPVLVVVVDKERVRVFASILADVQELSEAEGEPVDRHRQGGWSAAAYQRREDMHTRLNLKAVRALLSRAGTGFFRRIYLAGPTEARAEIRRLLPRDAAGRLAGDLNVPTYLEAGELAHRLEEILRKVETGS